MKEENKKSEIKKCELCSSEFIINPRNKREKNKRFCTPKCAKIHNGKANKGRKFSDEINKKKGLIGDKNPFFGKNHTKLSKEKMSKSSQWSDNDLSFCSLSNIEKQVLEGLVLSDGCLSEASRISSRLSFGFKFKETVDDICKALPSMKFSQPWQSQSSKCWHSKSSFYSDLLNENKRWYVNGKKIVPKDIIISPISCYWWFIGDGYNTNGNVYLCTDCFSKKEVFFLVNKICKLGFKCNITANKRIRFFKEDSLNFLKWLKENNNIHNQYKYKWEM
jgi:hypothetical protein